MPVLVPGRVFRSREPQIVVENELEPGIWRFRLTVIDDDRNESAPAEISVRVVRRGRPPFNPVPIDRIVRPGRPGRPGGPN